MAGKHPMCHIIHRELHIHDLTRGCRLWFVKAFPISDRKDFTSYKHLITIRIHIDELNHNIGVVRTYRHIQVNLNRALKLKYFFLRSSCKRNDIRSF